MSNWTENIGEHSITHLDKSDVARKHGFGEVVRRYGFAPRHKDGKKITRGPVFKTREKALAWLNAKDSENSKPKEN